MKYIKNIYQTFQDKFIFDGFGFWSFDFWKILNSLTGKKNISHPLDKVVH